MTEMKNNVRVRITHDLTHYNEALSEGAQGIMRRGMQSRLGIRFVVVDLDSGGRWDILPKSIEIIDEGYLSQQKRNDDIEKQRIIDARSIFLITGPRGNFKSLRYTYLDASGQSKQTDIKDRERAYELQDFCSARGVSVPTRKEK